MYGKLQQEYGDSWLLEAPLVKTAFFEENLTENRTRSSKINIYEFDIETRKYFIYGLTPFFMKIEDTISTFLYPNPAILVSAKHNEKESIITLSWAGTCSSNPPTVAIGVRPNRFSYPLIKESNEFVINIATLKMLEHVKLCGTKSGKDIDKWEECGFTRGKAKEIQTPLINECPANLECKVRQIIDLGSHHLIIGEIVKLHIDEDWKNNNYPDMITYTRGIYKVCKDI